MVSVLKTAPSIHQLKVILVGSKPPIWRRLEVPSEANLGWLHAVLQVAVGWTNSHLHHFLAGGKCYADTDVHCPGFEGDPKILEERDHTLEGIAPRQGDSFHYEYDFGDSWGHSVTVEEVRPGAPSAKVKLAQCMDGARACPPEDCGGVWGYQELLEVLGNPKHPEHKSRKAWLGRPLNAEAFDLEKTNFWLRKLKWPNVTEAALRKALMGRDGY